MKTRVGNPGVYRTVKLPKPSEQLRPWMLGFQSKVKIYDRKFPFSSDGYISPEGWFFQCDAYGHGTWCQVVFGCTQSYLSDLGWVEVWSFQSMFNKPQEFTPNFRWSHDHKLTEEQKGTMLKWCDGQKISLSRACGKYGLEIFLGEDD